MRSADCVRDMVDLSRTERVSISIERDDNDDDVSIDSDGGVCGGSGDCHIMAKADANLLVLSMSVKRQSKAVTNLLALSKRHSSSSSSATIVPFLEVIR